MSATTAEVVVTTRGTFSANGWGVWDNHTQQWHDVGHSYPAEAWKALLQVETQHPWELVVAEAGEDGRPLTAGAAAGGPAAKCRTCDGDGECFNCGSECRDCDGTGEAA